MLEKIRSKMESHVLAILEKPIITNEEYMLISGYLSKLEMEEEKAKFEQSREDSDKRLRALMELTMGGVNRG
jgi:hypothetical protein